MYGNFTSNLYKLSFTHYIFKYSIETQPSTPENFLDFWHSFAQQIKSHLVSCYNLPTIILKGTLYTNQQLSPDFKIPIIFENNPYSVLFTQSSNPFLTEKAEQKAFLKAVFEEKLHEIKYFHFENGFYNPFEVYEEKALEIVRWSGFSFQIKRFFNDFTLQISPKTLVFSKKNCFSLLRKIKDNAFEISNKTIALLFKGLKVQVKPHKDLQLTDPGFYRILDVLFPKPTENLESNEDLDHLESDIQFSLIRLSKELPSESKPLLLPLKYCILMGYLHESRLLTHFREPLLQISNQISHFLTILTRNSKIKGVFFEWKLVLAPMPLNMQLFKLDSNQILLSNFAKNLNLISYSLNSSQFEQQYKAIFCENPLLNFPSLENWLFFLHYENMELGDLLLNNIYIIVKKFGYNVIKPQCVLIDSFSVGDWLEKIQENTQKTHQLALVMIPNRINTTEFYEKAKTLITGKFGVPSQFFHTKNLENNKENEGFFLRILSQISAKMGFAPWALKDLYFSNIPTMVIGVNIRKNEKSLIISVVGSMNKDFSKYWSAFTIIHEKTSYMKEMGVLILEAIVKFRLVHGIFPENLMVFRDGEFDELCLEEKTFLWKLIGQYKDKEKVDSGFNLAFVNARISEKEMIFGIENINAMYQQRVSNPYMGSLLRITGEENAKYEKFLMFLQRNDNENDIMRPTKFRVSYGEGLKGKDMTMNLQNFCFHLVFLNFSFSSRTSLPAPMQYAYKLGIFAEIVEKNAGGKEELAGIMENLKGLATKGKLYFI